MGEFPYHGSLSRCRRLSVQDEKAYSVVDLLRLFRGPGPEPMGLFSLTAAHPKRHSLCPTLFSVPSLLLQDTLHFIHVVCF